MSQRFIRCHQCGLPHDILQRVCPSTGKPISRRDPRPQPPLESAIPARKPAPQPPPAPPPAPAPHHQPSSVPPRGAHRDLFGKTIGGKYVVRGILGEGGMGTVYEAEHLTIGRQVAVKVLHPNQARKKDAVRRFHQEARAAGAIGHPNICEVYDLGTLEDGSPYLVMERLVGETLADRIGAEGGLPFDDVIEILVQVLSGLVAAHEKGIVHRDIKPENVFLSRRVGCPPLCKLLDFGVSKVIGSLFGGKDEDLELTRTGMVMGTPYYMSPEQARGDRNLDARVDLYACGVILYEALTGRRPFTAANYNALLLQILSTKPKPARDYRPALPSAFDAVLDKAMARNREDRYVNATEFQRELQTLRDRHNIAGAGVLAEAMRALEASVPSSPSMVAHRPHAVPPPPPERLPLPPFVKPIVRVTPNPDVTTSSLEIPIIVSSGETPLSGENMPVESTDLQLPQAPRVPGPSQRASRSDASEFEEYPTQVHSQEPSNFFDAQRVADDQTTTKRGPEFAQQVAEARNGVRDTDVTGRPAAANDTDPTGRLPAVPVSPTIRVPPDGDQDTIVKSRMTLPLPKRRPRRNSAPEDPSRAADGLREGPRENNPRGEGARENNIDIAIEGDPTLLMPPRAPKAPRR